MNHFPFVSLLAVVAGVCSGCATPLVHPPPPRTAADIDAFLHPKTEDRPVKLKVTGAKEYDYVLVREEQPIQQGEFRRMYRGVVGSDDLDVLVMKRARAKEGTVIAIATGLTVLGVGGISLLALPQSNCKMSAGCGKGVLSALVIGGAGMYELGCIAVKGAKCIADGNVGIAGTGLTKDEAARFVARYDDRLAHEGAQSM